MKPHRKSRQRKKIAIQSVRTKEKKKQQQPDATRIKLTVSRILRCWSGTTACWWADHLFGDSIRPCSSWCQSTKVCYRTGPEDNKTLTFTQEIHIIIHQHINMSGQTK